MKRIALIFFIISMLIFTFGCSSLHKFNMNTAKGVMEFTRDSGEVVEEYLVAWPTYSGLIDGLPDMYKDMLPKEFWDAKNLTDELSSYCISLKEALDNPDKARCDFNDWIPKITVPPEVYYEARISKGMNYDLMLISAKMGKDLPFDEGEKKNEYVRGLSGGTAVRMANSVILEVLKRFNIPEIANLAKIIPALAL